MLSVGSTRLGDRQDKTSAPRMKWREVRRVVIHLTVIERVAHRAWHTVALPHDLCPDASSRVTGERGAHLGACGFETLEPMKEEVELVLLIGMADFRSRSKGRGFLEFVPERWELPPLREDRLPTVELGPMEISGSQPRQHRGMKVANRFATRRDSLEEVEDNLALLWGKPGSLGERDGCIMERPAHRCAL